MGSRKPIEIVIHIDETLDDEHRQHLEQSLIQDEGITYAHINGKRNHLMVVDYQPETMNSTQVLEHVTSRGVHAELIGGI